MSLLEYNWTITDKDASEEWEIGEYKVINENSGGGTFAPGSSQAVVAYICEYQHVEKFLDTVLGKTVKVGNVLKRSAETPTFDDTEGSTPEEHPYWHNFFAASADVKPLGKPEQTNDFALWDKALVTVAFRPNNYNIISDSDFEDLTDTGEYMRFTAKVPEGQADFQTTLGFFKFVTDPDHRPLEVTPGITVPALRTVYTWKQIPVGLDANGYPNLATPPNLSTLMQKVGSVNLFEFDQYQPGTVLFVTWTATLILPQVATANNYYWDIGYVFGIRDYGTATPDQALVLDEHIGWNYAYDPVRALWDSYTITGAKGGNTMYRYTDLNSLFLTNW